MLTSRLPFLSRSLAARADLFDPKHEAALRLFNGFYEGCPDLVIDLYARTLVIFNYADAPQDAQAAIQTVQDYVLGQLPWVNAVVVKTRQAGDPAARRGVITHGDKVDRSIREQGVRYAVELLLNQDASFYLDTRGVRQWALGHLQDKTVLNAFAYTGSLGVAACAGGAARVVHLDRNREFLNVAKTSYTLNGLPIHKADFQAGDFFTQTSRMRRANETFDCVLVDPPFFSTTSKGTVNLVSESERVLNKVRPLVADGGTLVAINNALFISGAEYMRTLENLCADGYLSIEELIPVPPDATGYPQTIERTPPVDPSPFNHSTKIAVLRVRRKHQGIPHET